MDLPLFSISAWWGWGARGTGRGFLALYQWFGSSFPSLQSRWWGYDTNCSAALTGLVCQLSVLVLTLSSSKTSLLLKLERKENVLRNVMACAGPHIQRRSPVPAAGPVSHRAPCSPGGLCLTVLSQSPSVRGKVPAEARLEPGSHIHHPAPQKHIVFQNTVP